jgi:hypothetical protein
MLRALFLAAAACVPCVVALLSPHGGPGAVDAGTALRLDVEGLVAASALVLEGRVLSRQALPTAAGRIATDFEIEAQRTWLGTTPGRHTVRLPGGVLPDGSGILIAGMPSLLPGEDVILFLTAESSSGARMPVGLSQGKLRVATSLAGEKVLVRHHAGLDLVHAPGEAATHGASQEHLDYAATVAEIHAAVQRKRLGGR